ncbi:hypothetical protein [Haloarcula halophila]|jgi:hypothetical protein|uniref:hypothetical protein n=1 Tax=Haloarcula TaxID=2237 RepID=UPI0023E37C0D|nr:hypothetical protein [Halomicroarcula sp. DFY41]
MEQKIIQLRDYQKEFEENAESFNISGFVRQKLDEEVIPNDQIPEEHLPDPSSGITLHDYQKEFIRWMLSRQAIPDTDTSETPTTVTND